MANIDHVARLVAHLPEVVDGERHGNRTWLVRGKPFAWDRPFNKADIKRFGAQTPPEGPILAVRVTDLAEKEAVLATASSAFCTIPHFNGFAAILLQLQTVTESELKDALVDGWLACAPDDLANTYLQASGAA